VGSPFFDHIVSANRWCSHNISQDRVAEAFLKELNALRTSLRIPYLSCQFFKLGYVSIYVVVLEFEFSNLCSGSVLSGCVKVLNLEFLKEEVL
jgi:hypothetical protein